MPGQSPVPVESRPDYFGPVVVPLFGDAAIPDDDGGGGTTTATTILMQPVFLAKRRTVIHSIDLLSADSATVDIDFFKHASGVDAEDGDEISTQATAIVEDVPLEIELDETENILEEGEQLSIVLSAAPTAPITAILWVSHGRAS